MILVTGASGLLGANVVSQAHERGINVIGLYHRHPIHIEGVKLLAVDFADQADTCRIFREFQPSSVVHCAAATDVDQCEEHPDEAHRLNATAAAAIAEITGLSPANVGVKIHRIKNILSSRFLEEKRYV